eukprot:761648-Hanusia_phi.AAC.1
MPAAKSLTQTWSLPGEGIGRVSTLSSSGPPKERTLIASISEQAGGGRGPWFEIWRGGVSREADIRASRVKSKTQPNLAEQRRGQDRTGQE